MMLMGALLALDSTQCGQLATEHVDCTVNIQQGLLLHHPLTAS